MADIKRLEVSTYTDAGFIDTDMYLLDLWDNIHSSSIIQSNTYQIANKAAIYLSKIAALFLSKSYIFRLNKLQTQNAFNLLTIEIKLAKNFFSNDYKISIISDLIDLRGVLLKFYSCKLKTHEYETMSTPFLVLNVAKRYYDSFVIKIFKPVRCRSPPVFFIFQIQKNEKWRTSSWKKRSVHIPCLLKRNGLL